MRHSPGQAHHQVVQPQRPQLEVVARVQPVAAYGTDDFWQRWTRTECAAKLAGVPIQTWLRRHGLDPGDGLELLTLRLDDLVLSLGRAVTHPTIPTG